MFFQNPANKKPLFLYRAAQIVLILGLIVYGLIVVTATRQNNRDRDSDPEIRTNPIGLSDIGRPYLHGTWACQHATHNIVINAPGSEKLRWITDSQALAAKEAYIDDEHIAHWMECVFDQYQEPEKKSVNERIQLFCPVKKTFF